MKNQNKIHKSLFIPLFAVFFASLIAVLIYGIVRYALLTRDEANSDALFCVLLETAPAMIVVLLAGLVTAICLKHIVSRPVERLIRSAKELTDGLPDSEIKQNVEARGAIAELGEELLRQSKAISELLQHTEEQAAQEAEARVKTAIACDIFKDAVPAKIFFDGFGFNVSAQALGEPSACADYVDSFLLNSQTAFFAVGDVCGRGLLAARTVLKLKNELRIGILSGKGLGEIVTELNRALYAENKGALPVTLFAGVFRSDNGEIRFVNMGHVSPVVMGVQTGFLQMNVGSALGVNEQITVGEESFFLYPGQGLVLGTRGVTEAKNAEGKMFGFDRLLATARLYTGNPYAAEWLVQAVKEHRGEVHEDDLAVLVLQYYGSSTRMPASPAAAAGMREDSESIYRALLYRAKGGR